MTLLLAEVISLSILPIVCFITEAFFSKPLSISVISPSSSIMWFLIACDACLICATELERLVIYSSVCCLIYSSRISDEPSCRFGYAPNGLEKFLLDIFKILNYNQWTNKLLNNSHKLRVFILIDEIASLRGVVAEETTINFISVVAYTASKSSDVKCIFRVNIIKLWFYLFDQWRDVTMN